MAYVCKACGREVSIFDKCGCGVAYVVDAEGNKYKRIKRGSRRDYMPTWYGRCYDCGVPRGTYHHDNCDLERCPKCGGQLFGCECGLSMRYDNAEGTPVTSALAILSEGTR